MVTKEPRPSPNYEQPNYEQLAMFMPAHQLLSKYEPNPMEKQKVGPPARFGSLNKTRSQTDRRKAARPGEAPDRRAPLKMETPEQVIARKGQAAYASGLQNSIRQQGIREPVNVVNMTIDEWSEEHKAHMPHHEVNWMMQGLHRAAAAHSINPNMEVSVLHHDEMGAAIHGGYPGSVDQRKTRGQL